MRGVRPFLDFANACQTPIRIINRLGDYFVVDAVVSVLLFES